MMKKIKLTLLLAVLMSMVGTKALAWDYDVSIDGLRYLLYNETKTAEVRNNGYTYQGDIVIPETVTYNGETYTVTAILNSAFRWCDKLKSVTIPNTVTTIGEYAFANTSKSEAPNNGLQSITIPNSVTSIDKKVFFQSYLLKSVTIGEGLESISEGMFEYCSYLSSLTILSDKITSIGERAFYSCSSLAEITIPAGVTSIGDRAFYSCTHLKTITALPVTPPTCGVNCFYNVWKSTCHLIVPEGSVEAYQAADQWKDFQHIETGITNVQYSPLDASPYYDLQGRRIDHPTKGVYIHNGRKVIVK